jgi:xanthine dehydrogenase accessory factor
VRVWHILSDLVERYGRCAMVTVIEVQGSAPREPGARLVVVDGGNYRGTIGGGALEWRALVEAQEALNRGRAAKIVPAVLGPDLGQCCGGRVTLLIETLSTEDLPAIRELRAKETAGRFATSTSLAEGRVERNLAGAPGPGPAVRMLTGGRLIEQFGDDHRSIFLFGAGHVGRAVVLALAPLPFLVTWIDSRSEAFPGVAPANVSVLPSADPAAVVAKAPFGAFVLVMTHSHALDLAISAKALAMSPIAYVGVIGSDTKRARFVSRLRAAGLADSDLSRFHCPIGLTGIRSKQPAVIAASLAADLLSRDEQLRASSGAFTLVHKTA